VTNLSSIVVSGTKYFIVIQKVVGLIVIEIIGSHCNKGFIMNNAQFVLSYELLALLRWLVDHDSDKLKKIISKSLKSGLQSTLHKLDQTEDAEVLNEIQHSITDFLHLLEALLAEAISEQVKEKARQQKLLPAVDQIDTNQCDNNTVRFSLEKATSSLVDNPNANAKELLFKELLKRWKPIDKNIKN